MTDIKPIEAWCVVKEQCPYLSFSNCASSFSLAKNGFVKSWNIGNKEPASWLKLYHKGYRCIKVTITPRVKE